MYDLVYKEILSKRAPDTLNARSIMDISRAEPIPFDLQHTLERKPDFLARCTGSSGNDFVLHIEYQSSIDVHMVYRMLEYYALIAKKFMLPVKQYVFYVGNREYSASETIHQSFD